MEERNKYGFVSGGHIFDYLDRKALAALNNYYPETKNRNFFTARASINYLSQCCDTSNWHTGVKVIPHGKWGRSYDIIIYLWQGDIRRAEGVFLFVEAKENKCKIKE